MSGALEYSIKIVTLPRVYRHDALQKDFERTLLTDLLTLVSYIVFYRVYEDVEPVVTQLMEEGVSVYIYSSGSSEAQRLLFEHTEEEGDISDVSKCLSQIISKDN